MQIHIYVNFLPRMLIFNCHKTWVCFTNVNALCTLYNSKKNPVYIMLVWGDRGVDVHACYLFISAERNAPLFPPYDMKSHINLSAFRDSTNLCNKENCRDAGLMYDLTTFRMHKLCLLLLSGAHQLMCFYINIHNLASRCFECRKYLRYVLTVKGSPFLFHSIAHIAFTAYLVL